MVARKTRKTTRAPKATVRKVKGGFSVTVKVPRKAARRRRTAR